MKEPCFPIEVTKINLDTNNMQVYEIAPTASVCYSDLKIEGKRVIILDSVPLNGTVVTVRDNKIEVYLFYRSTVSIPFFLKSKQTLYLLSKVENCIPTLESYTIPAGATNIQFVLIGAGGDGGDGGNGGVGFGATSGGGGGGAGSSGAPGEHGALLSHFIERTENEIAFKYRSGVSEFGCNSAPRITELILPDLTVRAEGGVFGTKGNNGGHANGNEPGAGAPAPPPKGNGGGRGGRGSFESGIARPECGQNGGGQGAGKGGGTDGGSLFPIGNYGTGGGGGGGGGFPGGTVKFVNDFITYDKEQLPVTGGGNGASGATKRNGNNGDNAPNAEGETPYGFGGNSGGGGGGGGGTSGGFDGGRGGSGGKGALGGKGVIILYYEI